MIHLNGQASKQQSFLLNSRSQPFPQAAEGSFSPWHIPQEPHPKDPSQHQHPHPLPQCLFFSGQSSQTEEHSCQNQRRTFSGNLGTHHGNIYFENSSQSMPKTNFKQFIGKKQQKAMLNRFKTDLDEMGNSLNQELFSLRKENKVLKQKVLKGQKTIIELSSVQSQLEYHRRLALLQQTEIEKLRKLLKHAQCQKAQLSLNSDFINACGKKEIKNHQIEISLKKKPVDKIQTSCNQNSELQRKTIKKKHSNRPTKENTSCYRTYSDLRQNHEQIFMDSQNGHRKKHSSFSKTSVKSHPKKIRL